ncbi:MAG: methionine synthase [Planctomycetota bacterium]
MNFNFLPTGIGSIPYIDAKEAVHLVLKYLKDIPFWPQLPQRNFMEGMGTQFSEGLPALVIDERERLFYIDTESETMEKETADFYERYLSGNPDAFAMSEDYASGFHELLRQIKSRKLKPLYVKGQISGPLTFGALVTDKDGKAIMHNSLLSDVLIKNLIMKTRWQIKKFSDLGLKSIIFLDEPYLMGYGSAFVPLSREIVIKQLTEVIDAIHNDGALVGIHCCGNTDWAMIMETPIDILNFDAYGFMDKLMLYADNVREYIDRDGAIAWGIVPSIMIDGLPSAKDLSAIVDKGLAELVKRGVDKERLMKQSIMTPSCGLGGLQDAQAEERLRLLIDIANIKRSA